MFSYEIAGAKLYHERHEGKNKSAIADQADDLSSGPRLKTHYTRPFWYTAMSNNMQFVGIANDKRGSKAIYVEFQFCLRVL